MAEVKIGIEMAEAIRVLPGLGCVGDLGDEEPYRRGVDEAAEVRERCAEPVSGIGEANRSPAWRRWKAASGTPDGRWRVLRYRDGPGITGENLRASDSRLCTFASYEEAQAAADKANAREEA